jgi:integrase
VNRVRAYEEASGLILVEYWERCDDGAPPQRKRHSLGHHDRNRAVRQVKAIAARLAVSPAEEAGGITLGSLFDIYLAEVTPRKGRQKQAHDRRAARIFLALFGRDRGALSLNLRDWDLFIDWRSSGDFSGKDVARPVGARQVAYDLSWLRAVFHWGAKAGADGMPLLERNPLEGYPLPRERSPARPVMTEEQYQALLSVIGGVNWRAELALVLANETGHRISAIRQLRWSDVDLKTGRIHWRAAHDKSGFDHVTPMLQELAEALVQARRQAATIGDGWVIPAVRDPGKPCSRGTLDKWFQQAARRLSTPLPARAGWHSLRRKFATELKDMPLKDLCYLGGWKDPKTLLECYQHPDEAVMREALLTRRPFNHTTVGSGQLNRQSRKTPDLPVLRKRS